MSKKLYALGNLTIDDIILYDTQQMFLGRSGGNVLFTAIGARIWHKPVGIIARAGKNYPVTIIEQITEAGIDVHLHRVPYDDLHNWALYGPGGARQFINHLSSGTHYEMSITGDEIPETCLNAAAYHIASMPTDVQASLVEQLATSDAIVSLDPHLEYLSQPNLNRLAYDILAKLDLFLPSQEEVVTMFGKDDPEAAARSFAEAGVSVIVIKLSTEGSLLYLADKQKMYHIPICTVETADPTGAGDSYCGGFLAGYLLTGDPVIAACYGTVSASFVVEHVGALNTFLPDLSQAQERLEDVKERVTKSGTIL